MPTDTATPKPPSPLRQTARRALPWHGLPVLLILLPAVFLPGVTPPAHDAPPPVVETSSAISATGPDARMAALKQAVMAIVNESAKLVPSDGATSEQFGRAVSLDGNRALVGAFFDNDNGPLSGSAYIFDFNGTTWVQTAKLVASDGAAGDQFGTAVSLHGNRALVGSPRNNILRGAAYVFDLSGTWSQTQKLTALDAAPGDRFGTSVSLHGSRSLIGSPFDNGATGSAYVWDLSGTWSQTAKLVAGDAALGDQAGTAVSLFASRALIGAPLDDDGGSSSGSAYVWDLSGTWSQTQKLTAGDAAAGDRFGASVSLDGGRSLIGAPRDNTLTGSAYVWDLSGTWSQTQKLTAGDAAVGDQFGASVSLDGNRALLGAPFDDNVNGTNAGSAYQFDFDGASWSETDKLLPSDGVPSATFGFSAMVSLSGARALVGAPNDDDNGTNSGSAYVFDLNLPPDCSNAVAGPDELWPPNHKFRDINVLGVTDPNGDPTSILVTGITQDEPLNGKGDGNTSPDADGVGTSTARVRSERSGKGNGRVYEISYTASDGQGGQCTGAVQVCVPHDQRPGHVCIDDGQTVDATGGAPAAKTMPAMIEATAYPNPFNPATTIAFELPEARQVELAVFNVMGRRVDTLVDGALTAGRHEVTWQAGNLPSGVYFYRITTGDFVQVRQMVLLK